MVNVITSTVQNEMAELRATLRYDNDIKRQRTSWSENNQNYYRDEEFHRRSVENDTRDEECHRRSPKRETRDGEYHRRSPKRETRDEEYHRRSPRRRETRDEEYHRRSPQPSGSGRAIEEFIREDMRERHLDYRYRMLLRSIR